MKYGIAFLALAAPAALLAQAAPAPVAPGAVTVKSETLVARQETDAKGQKVNKLYPAKRVVPGDVLVLKYSYTNTGKAPAAKFAVNTKVDPAVRVTDVREKWAVFSVDNGKSFGPLAALKVKGADGKLRGATTDDITNIRWTLAQPVAPAGTGDVMYYGVVR
jgi:hypothetical protein